MESYLQYLQDPREINGDNLKNIRCETSRYFRNKKGEYIKSKINEFAKDNENKNIRDLSRGMNSFTWCYQPRRNLVKDQNCDVLVDL
jgi:hypothetical protein